MRNDYGTNYLAHHGILGQKWGVRRYQNTDGSLTEAGKKRYGAESVDKIATAKGLTNRLNDIDKAKARNYKKMGKYISKETSRTTIWQTEYAKKVKEAQEYIDKGNKEVESLLNKASSEGYSIKSSKTRRLTSSGAEIIGRTLLGSAMATGMLLPFGYAAIVPNWSTTLGTKYKVKEEKQKR